MSLPVSIVIPHSPARASFFQRFCLPSVQANRPAEIIVEDSPGRAPEKRNAGAAKATQPFLLFVDDDDILGGDFLSKMLGALTHAPGAGYAYCDYVGLVWPNVVHPLSSYHVKGRPFDLRALKQENYINTCSLMRRDIFCGYDVRLRRMQDWDLWLRLAERGVHGTYIPETLFMAHFIDRGITASVDEAEALRAIRQRHSGGERRRRVPDVIRAALRKVLRASTLGR